MASKIYCLLIVAALFVRGQGLTWIELEDEKVTHTSHPFFGTVLEINKMFWDTLELCAVTFPNGVTYEAYPKNDIPSPVVFEYSAQPFTACVISFRVAGPELSGTYELGSLVTHSSNNSQTLTTKRFHLTIV